MRRLHVHEMKQGCIFHEARHDTAMQGREISIANQLIPEGQVKHHILFMQVSCHPKVDGIGYARDDIVQVLGWSHGVYDSACTGAARLDWHMNALLLVATSVSSDSCHACARIKMMCLVLR